MATLPNQPLMADYQAYVKAACEERGWDKRSPIEKMLFLTEEIGEVAKEVRKHVGTYGYKTPDSPDDLASELVDVFNYLLDIGNTFNIDLEQAFRKKWEKNSVRTWG